MEAIKVAIEIKTTNNVELLQKKQDRLAALRQSTSLPFADLEDLARLADAGMLNWEELALYDELSIVLMLLGEEHLESA